MLSDAVDHIKDAASSTNASFSGPVYLPTRFVKTYHVLLGSVQRIKLPISVGVQTRIE